MSKPNHHPDEALLLEYAGGGLTESIALVVATHLALCPICRRMVEEMGVDRHMDELLRRDDQAAMTDAAFREFLLARGMAAETVAGLNRGEADVAIPTGPHLGAFNNRTSLPELNEATAAAVAACLAARHARDRIIGR